MSFHVLFQVNALPVHRVARASHGVAYGAAYLSMRSTLCTSSQTEAVGYFGLSCCCRLLLCTRLEVLQRVERPLLEGRSGYKSLFLQHVES